MPLKHVDFEVPQWAELAQGPQLWHGYAQAVLEQAPVAYWRLGESGGATADDEVGPHAGSYEGGVTFGRDGAIERDSDTAVLFDGATGHVAVAHHAALELGGVTPATWLMWARKDTPASDDERWLLGKGLPRVGELRYLIEMDGGVNRIQFVTHDGSWHDVTSDTAASFVGWRMVAVTWDGQGEIAFYVDGKPLGVKSFEPAWFPATDHLLILGAAHASGLNDALFHFGGDLDEIALFDKALSAEVIADLYGRAVGQLRLG